MKLLPCLLLPLSLVGSAPAQIYADVDTSMGSFTIELNHAAAPQTVANFITLAEGTRPWIDHATGAVRTETPYYNDVTFHRVIANFMSQTGSRKGDGSDGPGYTFQDETDNGLGHSGPHIVSMANSGPNTNGSQFFITDVATSHLDGKHTVFGTISSGGDVVDAINNVPTNSSQPVDPVVIQTITIRRVGAPAQAFDEFSQGLPEVSPLVGDLQVSPGSFARLTLATPTQSGDILHASRSSELATWEALEPSHHGIDPEGDSQAQSTLDLDDGTATRAFYQLARAHHPGAFAPSHFKSRDLTLVFNNQTHVYRFDETGNAGTIEVTPAGADSVNGTFSVFELRTGAHHATIILETSLTLGSSAFVPQIKCGWESSTSSEAIGRQDTTFFSGGSWQTFASGTCEVTR